MGPYKLYFFRVIFSIRSVFGLIVQRYSFQEMIVQVRVFRGRDEGNEEGSQERMRVGGVEERLAVDALPDVFRGGEARLQIRRPIRRRIQIDEKVTRTHVHVPRRLLAEINS